LPPKSVVLFFSVLSSGLLRTLGFTSSFSLSVFYLRSGAIGFGFTFAVVIEGMLALLPCEVARDDSVSLSNQLSEMMVLTYSFLL